MPGDLGKPASLAKAIYKVLLGRSETREGVIDGLIAALEQADSFDNANKVSRLLAELGPFDGPRATRMLATLDSNGQVAGAWHVPARLRRITGTAAE